MIIIATNILDKPSLAGDQPQLFGNLEKLPMFFQPLALSSWGNFF